MKQGILYILCALIIFAAGTSISSTSEPMDAIDVPVKDITIELPAHFQKTKSPVTFSHSTHLRYSCIDCHHNWDRESPILGCMTSGCHEQLMPSPPKPKPSQDREVLSITGAFHKACLSCHREETNMAAGAPVECAGCHTDTKPENEYYIDSFSLPLGTITISPPEDVYAKRRAVNFPHGLHFDQDCVTCHHDWDGDSEPLGCMAAGCHDQSHPDESTRDINDPVNVLYFLTAYHKSCYQCHTDLKKQEKLMTRTAEETGEMVPVSNAPVSCDGCHNAE